MSVSSRALFITAGAQGDGLAIAHRVLNNLVDQLGLIAEHSPQRIVVECVAGRGWTLLLAHALHCGVNDSVLGSIASARNLGGDKAACFFRDVDVHRDPPGETLTSPAYFRSWLPAKPALLHGTAQWIIPRGLLGLASRDTDLNSPRSYLGVLLFPDEVDLGRADICMSR